MRERKVLDKFVPNMFYFLKFISQSCFEKIVKNTLWGGKNKPDIKM